jgi:NAD-dependent SIR2 family protein deacetylase
MQCEECRAIYELDEDEPFCDICVRLCKPNIVLYGESDRGNRISYKWHNVVIIIGTTLQFPYLRKMVKKYKQNGATIIHINPDDDYGSLVGKNEIRMKMKSDRGLKTLFDVFSV